MNLYGQPPNTLTPEALAEILRKHEAWLRVEAGGERANLSAADLRAANLSAANLSYANLRAANLSAANLSAADLSYANLSYANLSAANLRDADLSPIRDDLFAVLSQAPAEVPGLLAALRAGKVDGSTYQGACACLVGTIANPQRPAERFFLLIREGDTPDTNQAAGIAEGWIAGWLERMAAAFGAKEAAV